MARTIMDQDDHRADQPLTGIDLIKPMVLICVICSISLSPLTYQLSSANADAQEDLFVYTILLSLCILIIYLTYRVVKQRCPLLQVVPDGQVKSILVKVFSAHASPSEELDSHSPNGKKSTIKGNTREGRKRIDPKYFKPKYIINELITIWGTTYTVITWGSVWVIGGTIVATERLAQKIKTKCATSPHRDSSAGANSSDYQNSNRGTGFFTSYESDSDESFISRTSSRNGASSKSHYRRVRSWARKSYANARKRLNTFMNSAVPPQLTSNQLGTS